MARRDPSDQPWRPWLFDEVEHGLDARHPGLHQPRSDLPQLSPPRDDVLACCTPSARTTCCRSATTRWCTARARCGDGCRATTTSRRPACAALLAYQWAHPGKTAAVHGPGVRSARRMVRGARPGLVAARREQLLQRASCASSPTSTPSTAGRPALWSQDTSPEGYSWIDANDSANNVLSFLRYGSDGSVMACVFNFAGTEHSRYRLGLPTAGTWREVLNSDATIYNGSGIGNLGAVEAYRGTVARTPGLRPTGTATHLSGLAGASRRLVQRVGQVAPAGDDVRIGGVEQLEEFDETGPNPGALVAGGSLHQSGEPVERRGDLMVEDLPHRQRRTPHRYRRAPRRQRPPHRAAGRWPAPGR